MDINQTAHAVHNTAVVKGWYESGEVNIPEKIALIHSEASEMLEEYRKNADPLHVYESTDRPGKPEGFSIEAADVVIRVMDLCCALGIDLAQVIAMKMAYNSTRPYRHGNKNC